MTLPQRFPGGVLDSFVIMPNHFDGIVSIPSAGAQCMVARDPDAKPGRDESRPYGLRHQTPRHYASGHRTAGRGAIHCALPADKRKPWRDESRPCGYKPGRHHRRSTRLQGYDYSNAGAYFVTVCTQHRVCQFGEIAAGEMCLNDAGQRVRKLWLKLPQRFPGLVLDSFVVMPNHFHGIIFIPPAGAQFIAPDNPATNQGAMNRAPTISAAPRRAPFGDTRRGAIHCALPSHKHKPGRDESRPYDPGTTPPGRIPAGAQFIAPDNPATNLGAINRAAPPGRIPAIPVGAQFIAPFPTATNQGEMHRAPTVGEIIRAFKAAASRGLRQAGVPAFAWQRNYYEHIIRNEASLDLIRRYIADNPARWAEDRENPARAGAGGAEVSDDWPLPDAPQ